MTTMKISLHKNEKKPTALSQLLEKIEGYKWADDEDYSKLIAQVKDEPDPSKPDSLDHAGDLQPGQIGIDADGTAYLGFRSGDPNVVGAYEFDGLHRFFPGSGPEVCVHNIGEIHLVEDGGSLDSGQEEPDEPEDDNEDVKFLEDLKNQAKTVIEAYRKRSEKGSAGRLESAINDLVDLIGE
jgi:hypothetical protein